jgi:hypothetical protein
MSPPQNGTSKPYYADYKQSKMLGMEFEILIATWHIKKLKTSFEKQKNMKNKNSCTISTPVLCFGLKYSDDLLFSSLLNYHR